MVFEGSGSPHPYKPIGQTKGHLLTKGFLKPIESYLFYDTPIFYRNTFPGALARNPCAPDLAPRRPCARPCAPTLRTTLRGRPEEELTLRIWGPRPCAKKF